jgi:hypothetical protein
VVLWPRGAYSTRLKFESLPFPSQIFQTGFDHWYQLGWPWMARQLWMFPVLSGISDRDKGRYMPKILI